MTEPNIKILVSCHKETYIPDSDIYMPVHVGASCAPSPLPGMQPDDEGENISDRNFTFCELSAQYWAWKNLDADYIGLCHYRRFFCFDGAKHAANDHAQIEVDCLTPRTAREYRLDDTALLKERISACDMVVAPEWNVRGVPTPLGSQNSVEDHMISYGLIDKASLDMLREIVSEVQPSYRQILDDYLGGTQYIGYNCFVAKRAIFDRMCEFEFSILQEFDKRFDYANLTAAKRRICGYLGETIFSVFVMSLMKDPSVKVESYPLVFFFATDRLFDPSLLGKQDASEVVWGYSGDSPAELSVALNSLLHNIGDDRPYRITMLVRDSFNASYAKKLLDSIPEHVNVDWRIWPMVRLPENMPGVLPKDAMAEYGLVLPWLSESCEKYLWLQDIVCFEDDPGILFEQEGSSAAVSISLEAELQKPKNAACMERYQGLTSDPIGMSCACCMVDAAELRARYAFGDVVRLLTDSARGIQGGKAEPTEFEEELIVSAMLVQMGFKTLDFAIASQSLDEDDISRWGIAEHVAAWKAALRPAVVLFPRQSLLIQNVGSSLAFAFWDPARSSRAYELLLLEMFAPTEEVSSLVHKLLPPNTVRGKAARVMAAAIRRNRSAK